MMPLESERWPLCSLTYERNIKENASIKFTMKNVFVTNEFDSMMMGLCSSSLFSVCK